MFSGGKEMDHCLKWVSTDLNGSLTQLIKTHFIEENFEVSLFSGKILKSLYL